MKGVGLPGGPKVHGSTYTGSRRAKEQLYRQSDVGRLARRMYYATNPEARMKRNLRAKMRRHMKGLA